MSRKILPFPIFEQTNPISSISQNIYPEQKQEPHESFYFTIPLSSFRPSPCRLSDIASTERANHQLRLLIVCFHLINKQFFSSSPHISALSNNQGRKIRVFMEYILRNDTDIDTDISLIDTLGIRFHIHIFCDQIQFIEGIKALIENNGGELGCLDEDDEEIKVTKTKQKKSKPNRKDKFPRIYNAFEEVDHMIRWYDMANGYLNFTLPKQEYVFKTVGEAFIPQRTHALFPDNVFTWKNSLLENMHEKQKARSNIFAVPKLTFELPFNLLTNTVSICSFILPHTPLWFEQSFEDKMNTLQMFSNKPLMEALFNDKFFKRNDIKEFASVQADKIKRIESKYTGDELKKELLNFRKRSVKVISNCFRPGANVSEPIVLMTKWAKEQETWTTSPGTVDSHLSYFGQMIAKDFIHIEQDLRLSVTHSIFFRVLVNALGAYRYKLDLHNNVLMLGQGATGKSHILDTIAALLVPKTTTKVSHATEKAATIGSDNNDHISLYHELPPGMLGKDKNGAETGNHIIKDMMTSCVVNTVSIQVDHDQATREAISFESECVGVVLGATNERSDKIPEALSTRMIKMMVNEYKRDGFGVNEMTSSVLSSTDSSNKHDHELFVKRWRVRQVMLNMVEKMIYTQTLVDVDMNVFNLMQTKIEQYMTDKDILTRASSNIRDIKFMRHFARTLTIICACDKYANDPNSPGYKKEFSIDGLLDIQPLLFCTEEIALFTLTLNADQLINVHHFKLIEVLLAATYKHIKKNPVSKEPDVINGMMCTNNKYPDERKVYKDLIHAQNTGMFNEKLSAENLKVAFNEIRKDVYRGQSIIDFNNFEQQIQINHAFVQKHFDFDDELGRYKCKFDLNNLMENVFLNAFTNTFSKKRRLLVGTKLDPQAPFLLNTFDQKPNEEHVLQSKMAISTNFGNFAYQEENEFFVRVGNCIQYKCNFEEYEYNKYLEHCGLSGICDIEYLYKPVIQHTMSGVYPDDYAKWFQNFAKVKLSKRKRDSDNDQNKISIKKLKK